MKFESYSTMQSGGQAVCEILDTFLSKEFIWATICPSSIFQRVASQQIRKPLDS